MRRQAKFAYLIAAGVVALAVPAADAQAQAPSPSPTPSQAVPDVHAGCALAPQRGSHTLTLRSGGQARSALVHVPRGARPGRELPLVLVLHGFKGDGAFMERFTGYSSLADRRRFLVAYPNALGTLSFWTLSANLAAPDDVGFVRDLVNQLEATLCVNDRRVYAAGVSNGGGMVARLACELSDRIAAVAPVAGGRYDALPPCAPGRPVSVLEVHGSQDRVVPYDGVQPFLAGWAARDACAPDPTRERAGSRTLRLRWHGCARGSAVEHLEVLGGGHAWPGSIPIDRRQAKSVNATVATWSFFHAHVRAFTPSP